MSQTVNVPILGLHDLAYLKVRDRMDADQHRQEGVALSNNTNPMGSAGNSVASTPRSSGPTPRTPMRSSPSALTAMHSPLRMVGKTSPCSIKIKTSTRLEGGLLVDMPASSCSQNPKMREGSGDLYPRELSFGNLLDNDGVDSRNTARAQHPRPIGLCPKTDQNNEIGDSLPISPRKRSRKCAPLRSSFGAY